MISDLTARLRDACLFPEAGAPRFHLRPGLRAVLRHNHVAYYLADDEALTVMRVLHAARDLRSIFTQGGFPTT